MTDTSQGLINVASGNSVEQTVEKLKAILQQKGMKIFAHIDHSAGAKSIDKELSACQLILFGNPQTGTPLMQSRLLAAIDLPQKFLVSADEQGQVSISYNAPAYLAQRHDITGCDELLDKTDKALANIVATAAA